MPESQQEIDTLLAEVNALAEETVSTITGDGEELIAQPSLGPAGRAERASPATTAPAPAAAPAAPWPPGACPSRRPENVSRLLRIQVPVIVQLAERTMPLADILSFTTGAIIEFEKPADSELDLMINNKCIGQGQAVKVAENFGLRLTRIGSLRELIHALGAQ